MTGPLVCSIGTTHPLNVAGLGLDIATLRQHGARAASIVAGVSAQGADGLFAVHPVPREIVLAQFDALSGAPVAAFRVGALSGAASVRAVAEGLRRYVGLPIVHDPVIASSEGGTFADGPTIEALQRELFPLATLLTPNVDEAATLTGTRVCDVASMVEAARTMQRRGVRAVLVTGGHLTGAPTDVLIDGEKAVTFSGRRIDADLRGTGCRLAVLIALHLASGVQLQPAVARARLTLRKALLQRYDERLRAKQSPQ